MDSNGFKQKLLAILNADVAGYNRLMVEDDGATVRTLTGRRGIISTIIKQHQGNVASSSDNLHTLS